MERAVLPNSAGDTTSRRAYFTFGRNNTVGGKFNNEPTEEAALRDRVDKLEWLVGRLTLENELQPASEKREFITRRKHFLSNIRQGCRLMNIPRSSFYRKPSAKSSDRMKLEVDLVDRIEAICLEFSRYGYRRVTHQLKREGWRANHKKVLRLMRESDLLCQVKRK